MNEPDTDFALPQKGAWGEGSFAITNSILAVYILLGLGILGWVLEENGFPVAPIILGIMSQMMMRPSPTIARRYGVPPAVIREAYTHNPDQRARTQDAVAKVRSLLGELGLYEGGAARLWRLLGLSAPSAPSAA